MITPSKLIVETWDVNARLAEIGLTEQGLVKSAEIGLGAFLSCTRNHPASAPGFWAWAETIRALAEYLIPEHWSRVDESNWPLIENADKTIAISVATGNADTGRDVGNDPLTISSKGPRTQRAVTANRRQMNLFEHLAPPREVLQATGRQTWLLLVHRDENQRELRLELSRPVDWDDRGRINAWAERILLRPRPYDGVENIPLGGSNGPQSPEIRIDIKRRA